MGGAYHGLACRFAAALRPWQHSGVLRTLGEKQQAPSVAQGGQRRWDDQGSLGTGVHERRFERPSGASGCSRGRGEAPPPTGRGEQARGRGTPHGSSFSRVPAPRGAEEFGSSCIELERSSAPHGAGDEERKRGWGVAFPVPRAGLPLRGGAAPVATFRRPADAQTGTEDTELGPRRTTSVGRSRKVGATCPRNLSLAD